MEVLFDMIKYAPRDPAEKNQTVLSSLKILQKSIDNFTNYKIIGTIKIASFERTVLKR